jgi:hypothetical protein
MNPLDAAVHKVRIRMKQHQRGIFCRAEMWATIRATITTENAHAVLNSLTAEERAYLRAVYEEWAPSLWSGSSLEDEPLSAAIEAWCTRAA